MRCLAPSLTGSQIGDNTLLMTCHRRSDRFDQALSALNVETIGEGTVMCTMTVDKKVSNAYSTLHGGCSATLVDVVSTIAIVIDNFNRR